MKTKAPSAAICALFAALCMCGGHAEAARKPFPPKRRHQDRATTLVFSSATYGVSFQYPATYNLKTGDEAHPTWGYRGPVQMDFVQPGGRWVSSVELPADSYPKTDFNSAFFGLAVNTHVSASECARFAYPGPFVPGIPPKPPASLKLGENEFQEVETSEAAMNHQSFSSYYHVFRNDACYEFIIGIATAGYGVSDLQAVDTGAISHKLEGILRTATIRPVTIPIPKTPIRAFRVTPLGPSAPRSYRVSWDVSREPAGPLSLQVSCLMGRILQIAPSRGRPKRVVNCQKPIPMYSRTSALILTISNRGLVDRPFAHVKLTLSLAGNQPASEARMVIVPPSVIINSVFQGKALTRTDKGPFILQQGQPVLFNGTGFLPLNTVWIGSTRINGPAWDYGQIISLSLPESLPLGKTEMYVVNRLGRSNAVPVIINPPTPPHINTINGIPVKGGSKVPTIPFGGRTLLNIDGRGFLNANFVWIGSQTRFARSDNGSTIILGGVTPPPGTYRIFIVNQHGKSNIVKLVISAPKK